MQLFANMRLSIKLPFFMTVLAWSSFGSALLLAWWSAGGGLHGDGIFHSPVADVSGWMAAGVIAALLFLTCVASLISKPLTRPVAKLQQALEELASESGAPVARGELVRFGAMADTVSELQSRFRRYCGTGTEQSYLGSAMANSSSATMIVDRDMKIVFVNEELVKVLRAEEDILCEMNPEIDLDNLVGHSIDAFHKNASHVAGLVSDPENLPYTADIRLGDTDFALHITSVVDADGNYIGNVVEWTDVTEIRLQRALLRSIDNDLLIGHIEKDGSLIEINGNMGDCLAAASAEIVGRNVLNLFEVDRAEVTAMADVLNKLNDGQGVSGVFKVTDSEGGEHWLEGSFSPVRDNHGRAERHLFIGSDVTVSTVELQQAEMNRESMQKAQSKVVEGLRVGLSELSQGNLTFEIEEAFPAEYERLRGDFNASVSSLMQAMARVEENASSIRGEAAEINSAADDLSRRTEKQAATLEETAAALDELTSSVTSAADGAARANEVVLEARQNAERSGVVVEQAVEAMGQIADSSDQISKIIGVIDDIAFQTNLLALNAGVEAARAGDAGRGFAVVASEVRALAQRSSTAAREINDLITASGEHVRNGVSLVGETGDALKRIVDGVMGISGHVSEIAVSAKEQSTGLEEINTAVNQLDQVTQQNAAMFEQTTAASHALTRESEVLAETMSMFDTGSARQKASYRRRAADERVGANVRSAAGAVSPPVLPHTQHGPALVQLVDASASEDELDSDWEAF